MIRERYDNGSAILAKALEGVRALAEARARAFLCPDCRDQRCQQGQECKAYRRQVEACAWEIQAQACENN